jgi:peptidoglycan-associated lipoprotein
LTDAHFDYDRSDLRQDARDALAKNADWLKLGYNTAVIEIEGHCDERGTVEYNLALGERRAQSAMDYLVSLGVPANRLRTISYGKDRPVCTDSNESCWQRNRRAHLRIASK